MEKSGEIDLLVSSTILLNLQKYECKNGDLVTSIGNPCAGRGAKVELVKSISIELNTLFV